MGQLATKTLNRLFSHTDDDYERVLSELDDRIHQLEIGIAEAKLRCRKVTALLTTYSVMIYLLWLLSFFLVTWPALEPGVDAVSKVAPVILAPAVYAATLTCPQ